MNPRCVSIPIALLIHASFPRLVSPLQLWSRGSSQSTPPSACWTSTIGLGGIEESEIGAGDIKYW